MAEKLHFEDHATLKQSPFVDASQTEEETHEENYRTAILLLDFQNEFAKKGGKLHHEVAEMMETTDMLRNVPKLVNLAR